MILNDSIITVEKLGRTAPAMSSRLSARSAPNTRRRRAKPLKGLSVAGIGAMTGDGGTAAEPVGLEIDRDDHARPERARRRYRYRIDQRAVDQPAPADMDRRKNAGQCVRGAQRQRQRTARQPDFVAGADLGGDRRKPHRQILDQGRADRVVQLARQPPAADQAGAAEPHVEVADDPPHRQRARPGFQRVKVIGGVAAADQGAHRRADDDVGDYALRHQHPQHADMGEPARRAAAEHQPDQRPFPRRVDRGGCEIGRGHLISWLRTQ
jgi:hypothetical protein